MTLQIDDIEVRNLARRLAEKRRVSETEAVRQALEAELRRERDKESLAVRLARIADRMEAEGQPGGRAMDKDEIDAMWGH